MLLKANIGVVAVGSIANLLDQEFESRPLSNSENISDDEQWVKAIMDRAHPRTGRKYFSEADLVLDAETYTQAQADAASSSVSMLVESLLPLYQYAELQNPTRKVFHFPGTIVRRVDNNELTVLVPLMGSLDDENRYSIARWLRPVDFTYMHADAGKPAKGTVTLNYPASSAVLIAYRDTGEPTPNGDPVRSPISAEISPNSVDVSSAFGGEYTIDADGDLGIDSAYAYGTRVHIFQRVFTQSSTFRFQEPSSTQPALEPTP